LDDKISSIVVLGDLDFFADPVGWRSTNKSIILDREFIQMYERGIDDTISQIN
jgi:hypothetical protein